MIRTARPWDGVIRTREYHWFGRQSEVDRAARRREECRLYALAEFKRLTNSDARSMPLPP